MFGLEKESLRVLEEGTFSHKSSRLRIVILLSGIFVRTRQKSIRKFTAESAVQELQEHYRTIQKAIYSLPVRESIWPFSNPS